jgi:hypothetical protein
MALSSVSYTGDGSTTLYTVTIPYIAKSHIKVSVNDVLTSFTWNNDTQINISPAPANAAAILIYRETSIAARLVDFEDNSTVTERLLDKDGNQAMYLLQEHEDRLDTTDEDVTGLSARMTQAEADINAEETARAAADAVLTAAISTEATTRNTANGMIVDALEALDGRVDATETAIDSLEATVATLDPADQSGRLQGLEDDVAALETDKAPKASPTFTGNAIVLDNPAATDRYIKFKSGGVDRITIGLGNAAESGSNAGANFAIRTHADDGTDQGVAVSVNRAKEQVQIRDAAGSTNAGVYIPESASDPSAPSNGEVWNTAAGLKIQRGGAAKEIIDSGTLIVPTGRTKAYTLYDRFGEEIKMTDFITGSKTINSNDDHTDALLAAQVYLNANYQRGRILMPPGEFRLGTSSSIDWTTNGVPFVLEGAGREATKIEWVRTTGNLFEVGSHANVAKYEDIAFKDFTIHRNAVATNGAAFLFRHIRKVLVDSIYADNMYDFMTIGDNDYDSSVHRLRVHNCFTNWSNMNMHWCFNVLSASGVDMRMNKHNGTGKAGSILHRFGSTVSNIDGYHVDDSYTSQFETYFWGNNTRCPVNLKVQNTMFDRPDGGLFANLLPTNGCSNWIFQNNSINGGSDPNTNTGFFLSGSNGGTVKGLIFNGNHLRQFGGRGIWIPSGCKHAIIHHNQFMDCGHDNNDGSGVQNILIGSGVMADVRFNRGWRDSTGTYNAASALVEFNAPVTAGRFGDGNYAEGYTTTIGTP